MLSDDPTRRSRVECASDRPTAWALVVAHSADAGAIGREIVLPGRLAVGRSESAGVHAVIRDPEMSRHHATLSLDEEGVLLEDPGSMNGTYVDGRRTSSARLRRNAVVRMGDTVLVLDQATGEADPDGPLLGRSPGFLSAIDELDRAAEADIPVLLYGETGTGKELAAQRVHARSRRSGAFVPVNCAAIPRELVESQLFGHRRGAFTGATQDAPGYFRAARDGTLFLDEVGELSPYVQPKLLRALANHEVTAVGATQAERSNARVVAATNVDLALAVDSGSFRRDLYARLAGVVVTLPPLRERRRDIAPLLGHFLSELGGELVRSCDAAFVERLLLHSWPMNVRELRTVAQRVALRREDDPVLGARDARPILGEAASGEFALGESTAASGEAPAHEGAPERHELEQALLSYAGNVTELAKHYGKNPKQVYRWLKKHELRAETYRR